jgi:hypothetical protein
VFVSSLLLRQREADTVPYYMENNPHFLCKAALRLHIQTNNLHRVIADITGGNHRIIMIHPSHSMGVVPIFGRWFWHRPSLKVLRPSARPVRVLSVHADELGPQGRRTLGTIYNSRYAKHIILRNCACLEKCISTCFNTF